MLDTNNLNHTLCLFIEQNVSDDIHLGNGKEGGLTIKVVFQKNILYTVELYSYLHIGAENI